MKHSTKPPRCLNELLASAAPSNADRAHRWAETRRAMLEICPHLVGDLLEDLGSRDLRIFCAALDLFYFRGAFGSTFEREINPVFCWRVEEVDLIQDAWLTHQQEGNNHYFEVFVSRKSLARLFGGGQGPVTGHGHFLRDPLDAVLEIIIHMMLRGIAIGNAESGGDVDRLEEFLVERVLPGGHAPRA